ncbi:uncharacterized protein E0L32_009332 [Thyridium curvatum]|uniref:Uncharacterized protein n=1 Tax=Thyridium curvatum TaxID=1093900 RepID=A0A507ASD9_9PEZI|nr:uncharacterized protein E0L32_009332 [Thyridium curvatum]TPX09444.1 hypothetical protein E0L32_009332 [Thyridium curvatum]
MMSTLFSLSPFVASFAIAFVVASRKVFPKLSRVQDSRDGEDHYLPSSAPPSLQQAHAEHGAHSLRRKFASFTFATTIGLATVLGELILAEISDLVNPAARTTALRFTVPTLLFFLIVLIPFLELQSIVAGTGWSFQRTAKGRIPRVAWMLQMTAFAGWLFVFWSLGRAVPGANESYMYARDSREDFDSTGISMATREGSAGVSMNLDMTDLTEDGGRGLARACLERIGIVGISLMALLSGFASVSSPWHLFADNLSSKRRPVTDADIARKQSGLDATREMLLTKRHRLRSLQRKAAAMAEASGASSAGLMGKLVGSIKNMGGGGDTAEIKMLQMEINGLESMEASLTSSLSVLQNRQAADVRAGTALGKLFTIPTYVFSLYCVYRIAATTLTTLRRLYYPGSSFSSSDPINRFLGLLAKHWDPKLDQMAWARQISFLLSGVILAASANSVLQTLHLFAKWLPGLLRQAQANLALLVGQIAATYVISAALLLRGNLPREVGSTISDALESALEPGFVDRWFEGWFLVASAATAAGIWVGRKVGGGGGGVGDGMSMWDEWDDLGGEEMGQKRS